MKKKYWSLLVSVMLFFQIMGLASLVKAESDLSWGEVQQGAYTEFYPYTFLWSGNPLDGTLMNGMNLTTMKMTSKKAEIDMVINQYGAMAANGIIELEEELSDPTDEDALPNFSSSVQLGEKKVYLIVTSDDEYVKIRIDRILPTKVSFSYVSVAETSEEEPEDVYYEMEEGNVTVSVTSEPGDGYYQLYRSDNGGSFVKLTDFPIYEPYFEDKHTLAGHSYVYYFEIFDASDTLVAHSVYINVDVIKPTGAVPAPVPVPTPAPAPSSFIKLQVNSKTAHVNGIQHTLDVPPTIKDGRTLVPIRFVSEALGAQVQWNAKDRSVTISHQGTVIILWLDKSIAKVNGRQVTMDVPAQVMQGRTMVPVRFVSENLNQEVSFDQKTYIIEIRGKGGSSAAPPADSSSELTGLFGSWDLWVPGGFDSYGFYTPGAGGDVLTLSSNGAYSWKDVGGKVVEGKWVQDGSGLLLKGAEYGWDWNVFKTDSGIKVSTFGTYYEGTRSK